MLLVALSASGASAGRQAAPPPAGIVKSLQGEAWVRGGKAQERRLRRFEWIPPGAVVRTSASSEIVVALTSGRQYRVRGSGVFEVTGAEATARSGGLERLEDVPPLPLAAPASAGAGLAAVRIRAGSLEALYPADPARAIAGRIVLSFRSRLAGARYAVEVSGRDGAIVHAVESDSPRIELPQGLLSPGERYYWRVRAESPAGVLHTADATFETLPASLEAGRAALRRVAAADDGCWLAAIDESLGLLREARETWADPARQCGPEAEERLTRLDRLF